MRHFRLRLWILAVGLLLGVGVYAQVVTASVKIDPGTVDAGTHTHKWQQTDPSKLHPDGYSAHIDERCTKCQATRHTQWGRDVSGNVVKPDGGAK